MRILHCTVAIALLAGVASAQTGSPSQKPAHFTVFLNGTPVGTEEVTLTRDAEGMSITGTSRMGPPLNLTMRQVEIRYAPDGRPIGCTLEGMLGDDYLLVRTVVNGTTATTDTTQGAKTAQATHPVSPTAVLLPNYFFGSYEALASRMTAAKAGDELRMFIPGQGEIGVGVTGQSEETIRTPAGAVRARRVSLVLRNPGRPVNAEVWVDPAGRLVRLMVPGQSFDYARTDIVSVASRREPVSHPGDEHVQVAANGFNLATTISRPASVAKGERIPAIVLVSGSPDTDRDEAVAGVPIFGQLASALADAGFIVARYDRRGVGQSGGRVESATLADYAEDVRALVRAVRKRKDVDPKRVAVLGYGQGGPIAMLASRDNDIRALVLVASPGVHGAEFILQQQARQLAAMNIPEEQKQAKIALQKRINEAALSGRNWNDIPPAVRKQAETPWFQSVLAFDPAEVVPKLRQPILIVSAALDREVASENGVKLETLARERKPPLGLQVRRVDLPGVNHLFAPAVTGEVDEYGRLSDKTVSSQLPAAIADWLKVAWVKD
jgi:pimeloyl-ACP methyl ester carboxylesterase